MAFTIPNDADAFNANQAEIDKVDLDIVVAGIQGNGVIDGCAVTAQGSPDMTVAVAAGLIRYSNKSIVVASGNVTIGTADGTHPRFDLITVNDSGTKACTAGTAAAEPVFPSIPASSIVLAAVYVPANDTTIATNQITDKRVFVPGIVTVYKAADETVNNSNTLQDDDDLKFDGDANSIWQIELTILAASTAAADIKMAWGLPSGATADWAPIYSNTGTAFNNVGIWWGAPSSASANPPDTLVADATALSIGMDSSSPVGFRILATIFIGATAGTVNFQWAQNTITAVDTKVFKGSNMIARRLGT